MTNETTIQKLIEMRLPVMAEAFRDQQQEHTWEQCSFEERFGLLVDLEFTNRKNNRLKRLVQQAGFDQTQACVADINFTPVRKLDKATIERLATCQYIEQGHNIILLGPSGAGKSYLACAFGMEACKHYYSVKYMRLPELLTEMAIARGEGSYKKVLQQYRKVSLLVLDEWMLLSLTETEARDVLEIVHSRHKRASTIFCSQFAPAGWHGKIGEATLADAILDRIVHDSYTIQIRNGDDERSMREVYGINPKKVPN